MNYVAVTLLGPEGGKLSVHKLATALYRRRFGRDRVVHFPPPKAITVVQPADIEVPRLMSKLSKAVIVVISQFIDIWEVAALGNTCRAFRAVCSLPLGVAATATTATATAVKAHSGESKHGTAKASSAEAPALSPCLEQRWHLSLNTSRWEDLNAGGGAPAFVTAAQAEWMMSRCHALRTLRLRFCAASEVSPGLTAAAAHSQSSLRSVFVDTRPREDIFLAGQDRAQTLTVAALQQLLRCPHLESLTWRTTNQYGSIDAAQTRPRYAALLPALDEARRAGKLPTSEPLRSLEADHELASLLINAGAVPGLTRLSMLRTPPPAALAAMAASGGAPQLLELNCELFPEHLPAIVKFDRLRSIRGTFGRLPEQKGRDYSDFYDGADPFAAKPAPAAGALAAAGAGGAGELIWGSDSIREIGGSASAAVIAVFKEKFPGATDSFARLRVL